MFVSPFEGDVATVGEAYSVGDNIAVKFSHDTNYGRGPPGCFEKYDLWPVYLCVYVRV